MLRLFTAISCGILLLTLFGTPAAADAPETFTISNTFTDVNPCSGEDHEVTLIFEISEHPSHANNFVAHLERSGTTSSGYTMIAGTQTFVETGNTISSAFVDQWVHPDGSRFRVRGNFLFNTQLDEMLVDNFSLLCIGRR